LPRLYPKFWAFRPALTSADEHAKTCGPISISRLMTQVNRTNELMTVCRSSAGVPAVGAAPPGGRRGCGRGRWARFPRTKACTGGSRLWFPILRSAFQKRPSSCGNLRGRRWVRTTGFSLVRRNRAGDLPRPERSVHPLDLRKPWLEMSWGAWESVHGGSRKWFPDHLAPGLPIPPQNAGHRPSRDDRPAPRRSDHPPAGRRRRWLCANPGSPRFERRRRGAVYECRAPEKGGRLALPCGRAGLGIAVPRLRQLGAGT
jgi:hypothetical protein